MNGRLHTRYAPVRRSPSKSIATPYAAPRLACVRPAASVYPEPGSNSPLSMLSWSLASEFNVALSCTRPYLSDNLFDCLSVLAIFILSRNSFLDPSLNESFSCGCQRSPADLLSILRDSLSPLPDSRCPLGLPTGCSFAALSAGSVPLRLRGQRYKLFFCFSK